MSSLKTALAASVVVAFVSATGNLVSGASAGTIPYPDAGTPNPVTYTFTATSTGTITAYFAGSGASYEEQVGMLVNGMSTGVVGLDDQSSTPGESLDLGSVTAGDVLTFVDYVSTTGNTWYSNPSLNSDGGNHVYSTSATAGQLYAGSPAGTYVGFEDLAFPGSDYNYYDDTFVFTDVSLAATPLPSTWFMMLLGLSGLGYFAFRGTKKTSAALAA